MQWEDCHASCLVRVFNTQDIQCLEGANNLPKVMLWILHIPGRVKSFFHGEHLLAALQDSNQICIENLDDNRKNPSIQRLQIENSEFYAGLSMLESFLSS